MGGAVDFQKVKRYPRGHWQTVWVHSLLASWICEMRLDLHRGLWPSVTLAIGLGKQDHPVLYLSLHVYGFRACYLRLTYVGTFPWMGQLLYSVALHLGGGLVRSAPIHDEAITALWRLYGYVYRRHCLTEEVLCLFTVFPSHSSKMFLR